MTNVIEKIYISKAVNQFNITDVIELEDEVTVMGEGKLYCVVSKNSVIHAHPGATGCTADRYCDRANSYHISPNELWGDGTDEGYPAAMVSDVFHLVNKEWRNEDEITICIEKVYCGGWVKVWGLDQKAIYSWDGQMSNNGEVQKVINAGFWVDNVKNGEIICKLYGQTEVIDDDQFPKLKLIRPSKNEVVFHKES